MSIAKKTALITGSNSGIGLGIARELAKAGATGVTPQTTETVVAIAQRPETAKCIAQNGLSLFS